MGIYPEEHWERKPVSSTLAGTTPIPDATFTQSTPGISRTIIYKAIAIFEERTNCFCCSCGEREGSDPACRNHGWAALRPCEKHQMPGQPWGYDDDEELDDLMPLSVEQYRAGGKE